MVAKMVPVVAKMVPTTSLIHDGSKVFLVLIVGITQCNFIDKTRIPNVIMDNHNVSQVVPFLAMMVRMTYLTDDDSTLFLF